MTRLADFFDPRFSVNDISQDLRQALLAASARGAALSIEGGGTKAFYGRTPAGASLPVARHCGIVDYEPSELVITARGGTSLNEIETVLEGQGQMLAFDPPHFGEAATLGGAVAAGLSGPRRPFAGAVRDFVLGCKLLDGKGETLNFGGRVMKNVAGYDVSRLMAGAMGTLGVLLEVSLKVLPRPAEEATVCFEMMPQDALQAMNRWAGRPLPLSALCFAGGRVHARLSGAARAVAAARAALGGEILAGGERFWADLREQRLPFFRTGRPLWRLSLAPASPELDLPGEWLYDWGGAQRWLVSEAPPERVFAAARERGGHATLFRGGNREGDLFQPLSPKLMALQRNLKLAFDPAGLFNPQRIYREW